MQVCNLTFHGIGVPERCLYPGESNVWIDTTFFRCVLDAAAERDNVIITFDDGNISDWKIAYPELVARGMNATFFVSVSLIGHPAYLSLEQVKLIVQSGMEIGLHGAEHIPWTGLSQTQLAEQVSHSKMLLEEMVSNNIVVAACPFGRYDRMVLQKLRDESFKRVYTSDGGLSRVTDWLQSRYSIKDSDRMSDMPAILNGQTGGAAFWRRIKTRIKSIL
jgi:peptidoglycan/xylan/chitin deacetylase (PgdA/CDA1 family)